uniref:Uncharacterized protein n=1 Tax=Timema genevievae TaxID=629358 RepID=A0A7R9JR21_TIMGE|nr:unnamed protein product [Timema genevievae]
MAHLKQLGLQAALGSNEDAEWLNEEEVEKPIETRIFLDLLKFFHELSESGNNSFSRIDKLSELSSAQKSGIVQAHPSFGFKVSLVRLIGNLCWKHRANQQVVSRSINVNAL